MNHLFCMKSFKSKNELSYEKFYSVFWESFDLEKVFIQISAFNVIKEEIDPFRVLKDIVHAE